MGSGQIQPVDLRNQQAYPVPVGNANAGASSSDANFRRVVFQKFVQDLTNAGGGGTISGSGKREDLKGTGLMMVRSSGGNGVIEIQHNDQGDFIPYEKGTGFNPAPFEFLKLRWDAQAGVSITLCYWTDSADSPIE